MNRLFVAVVALVVVAPTRAAEVESLVKLSHGSDLFRGCPFDCATSETQYDAFTFGATIKAGRKQAWEIDLSHGVKWVDRGPREGASELDVRFYPGRLRH